MINMTFFCYRSRDETNFGAIWWKLTYTTLFCALAFHNG